jgi:hypothetical protein
MKAFLFKRYHRYEVAIYGKIIGSASNFDQSHPGFNIELEGVIILTKILFILNYRVENSVLIQIFECENVSYTRYSDILFDII